MVCALILRPFCPGGESAFLWEIYKKYEMDFSENRRGKALRRTEKKYKGEMKYEPFPGNQEKNGDLPAIQFQIPRGVQIPGLGF